MTPDNSNISSLFGDMPQDTSPAVTVTPEVSTSDVSGTVSEGIFSAIQVPASSEEVVVSLPVATEVTPPLVPSIPEIPVSETSSIIIPKNIEALSQTIASPVVEKVPEVAHEIDHGDDEKLK